ncbi:uncharacterized protein LOC132933378 [Metopolophium dirhodum]|uniref:uncharacterized protein LOC132933378 n=1 Tax=Metopolophium dirhodum TaxID=44670 RepID=UPI00298F8E91|nr:uncharacterized protein LOC132933378 [Metopolophium dirhodum]
MSDMELTDEEGGCLEEVRAGAPAAGVPEGDTVAKVQKRKRVDGPEEEGISECSSFGISSFPQKARNIGRDLDALLLAEKEKRKISAAALRTILEIRERYEALLDEAYRQNTVLQGRVEEARRSQSRPEVREVVVERTVAPSPPKKKKKVEDKAKAKSAAAKEKVKGKVKEQPFVEVVSRKSKRKKKKKKKNEEKPKEQTRVAITTSKKVAKAIEREKARAPARAFVVSVGAAGASEAKKQLWADLVKGVAVPKLGGSAKLPRGDLVVRPADEATYAALKAMEKDGKGVREESARWPTVLVYDVDREIPKEKLAGQIVDQNPELGLDKEAVVPLFMKGPKTDELVWWVCSVRPSAFKTLVGKSLFIGLAKCKVKEYVDVVRCFKCQHFGHRALKCVQTVDTCGRCAVKGHRAKDCKSVPVKCANCGLAAQSGHSGCVALHKATITVARRTDFGSK